MVTRAPVVLFALALLLPTASAYAISAPGDEDPVLVASVVGPESSASACWAAITLRPPFIHLVGCGITTESGDVTASERVEGGLGASGDLLWLAPDRWHVAATDQLLLA